MVPRPLLAAGLLLGCSARYQPLECPKESGADGYQLVRTTATYDVTGGTFAEYTRARKKAAPFGLFVAADRPALALTDSRTCLRYQLTGDDTQCALGAVRLLHLVRVTTPRWLTPAAVTGADLELSRADDAVLVTHEEGHVRIAEAAARHELALLQKIGAAPTCEEVDARVKTLVADVAREVKARQQAYDDATDHGRKQSAVAVDALPTAFVGWD